MKELKILKSSNGWEYTDIVIIKYNNSYDLKRTLDDVYYDDPEQFNAILVDGVFIELDERCELVKKGAFNAN